MKFEKFDETLPKENEWIIVTNNIEAKVHGRMTHLWLTTYFAFDKKEKTYHTFDGYHKICNLTHWKYAFEVIK